MISHSTRLRAPIAATGCVKKASTKTLRRVRAAAIVGKEKVGNELLSLSGQQKTRYDVSKEESDEEYWYSAYEVTQEAPEGYWVEEIEGQIPLDLHGTYFRNGPGEFNFLDEPVVFPFDANGIVGSVAIKDGKAFFRSRFVETRESMMEEMAGRRLFRGLFGTIPKNGVLPFFALTLRNAGNGMTFLGKNKLYAADEVAELTELDPVTLETLWPKLSACSPEISSAVYRLKEFVNGPSDVLNPREVAGFGDNWYDGSRNVTVCHGYRLKSNISGTPSSTEIKFYEIDEDLKLYAEQQYTLDGVSTVHSIGITENYYIVSKFPMYFDLSGLLDSNAGTGSCVRWDPNGTHELHLVPRPSHNEQNKAMGRQPRVYKMEKPSYMFHFINAYEEDGNVVVDAIHYPEYPDFLYGEDEGQNSLDRMTLPNTARWWKTNCSLDGKTKTQEMSTRFAELPNINPNLLGHRCRYAYMIVESHPAVCKQTRALAKVELDSGEMEIWTKDPYYFVGEPLFVPRPNSAAEDDGWVMAFCYNGKTKKSEFVILDAKDVNKGPVATLYLDHAVGHGFHGHWTKKFFGPHLRDIDL